MIVGSREERRGVWDGRKRERERETLHLTHK